MFDPHARIDDTARAAARASGMNEPGIFKGCTDVDGPLAAATKDAILAYLGKPNAAAWERLRLRAIAGRTTLGDAWALSNPTSSRRHPNAAEVIRAMRVAVISQWASGIVGSRQRH